MELESQRVVGIALDFWGLCRYSMCCKNLQNTKGGGYV